MTKPKSPDKSPELDRVFHKVVRAFNGQGDTTAVASATATFNELLPVVKQAIEVSDKVITGGANGHILSHGTPEEKDARYKEMMDTCLELYKEDKTLRLGKIRTEAAKRLQAKHPEKLGYSFSAIEKHTPTLNAEIAKLK